MVGYTYLYVSTSGWRGYGEAVKQTYLVFGIVVCIFLVTQSEDWRFWLADLEFSRRPSQ